MKITTRISARIAAFAAFAAAGALVYGALTVTPSAQPFGYAPSVALSGFDLSTGGQIQYQTWFDPVVWRGDVAAYKLGTDGAAQTPAKWLASERIKAQNWDSGRRIVTRNAVGTNVAFRWSDLSAAQQTALGDNTTGPKVLNFLRGDRSNEKEFKQLAADGKTVQVLSGSATGTLRPRASVLGDIVHAKPVYVGAPPANYVYDDYAGFKKTNSARKPRVYAGANDGMLHAFDGETGDEVFAYVPSMLIPKLKQLSDPAYSHAYFVDGQTAVGDAYLGSAWKTVLVGSLGGGGRGLYALDVTDAAAADEAAAKAKILWEVSSSTTGFGNLGLTYAEPVIAKLSTGKWAAIVGNGYSDANDVLGSTGTASLYVIDLATGALIKEIDTGSGTTSARNGLSSATAVDTDGDGAVDTVYAGDLEGQMWKFDLSAKTPSTWSTKVLFQTSPSRPIVGAPDVAGHPLGGFLVYFATGGLFTADDGLEANKTQNYAYAIWDGAPSANKTLFEQKLVEATFGTQRVRVSDSDDKLINWSDATKTLHKGWRTELPFGEHVIGNGFVRDGRYHFTSVDPTTRYGDGPSGDSWLMELDYLNGGTNGTLVFNLNEDSVIDEKDAIAGATGNARVPVGIFLGAGLWSQPVLAIVNSGASTTLFNSNPLASPGEVRQETTPITEVGIKGGHFDYDYYNTANSATNKHVHMYDDMYNVTGASFTASSDSDFNLTANSGASSTDQFFVLISNGDMSPGVNITVGGKTWKAYEFPNKFDGTQPYYTTTTVKKFQFEMPDNVLDAKDWGTGVIRTGLHPSAPECVIYDPTLNIGGRTEIHNGALTIWVLKKSTPKSAISLNVAGNPAKGYKVTSDQYVLKKWTVFWHNGKVGIDTAPCYGEAGWTMTPAIDPDADSSLGATAVRAANSEDPSGLPRFTLTSNNVTFTASSTYSTRKGDYSGTYTIVNKYADGTVVTTVQVVDKNKNVVSTTTTTEPGATSTTTVTKLPQAQSVKPPPSGWDQTRDGGKLGRIAWREIIRD